MSEDKINIVLLRIIKTWDQDKCLVTQFAEKYKRIPTLNQLQILGDNCKCESCRKSEGKKDEWKV